MADVADGIDDNVVEHLAEQIRLEVKSIPIQNNYDISSFTYASAVDGTSNVLSFIARLVSDGAVTKVSPSLAQSIQHPVAKWHNQTTVGLAVKCHHRFGSKEAIDLLHEYDFAVKCDEVCDFENLLLSMLLPAHLPRSCRQVKFRQPDGLIIMI